MQREPTRGQNLLDLFCCNKPSLVKSITSSPGISDHNIVLADCKLKPSIITKPQRKIYQWSKADWRSLREQTVVFAEEFLASATTRRLWLASVETEDILTPADSRTRKNHSFKFKHLQANCDSYRYSFFFQPLFRAGTTFHLALRRLTV